MAKFLSTTGISYHIEELLKARSSLILISPYLRLNERVRELLEDKNRLKIDVRIVYGKSELRPEETEWLASQEYIRTSFCQNLHAKCYINGDHCIITSLNLYEFSQVNNNEMGVLISKTDDPELYRDAFEEAQRIIRISDEGKPSFTKEAAEPSQSKPAKKAKPKGSILSMTMIETELQLERGTIKQLLLDQGLLELQGRKSVPTTAGRELGAVDLKTSDGNVYYGWPLDKVSALATS